MYSPQNEEGGRGSSGTESSQTDVQTHPNVVNLTTVKAGCIASGRTLQGMQEELMEKLTFLELPLCGRVCWNHGSNF